MRLPRQLLQIDYDQYHRYAAVTVLLKPLLEPWTKSSTKPIRILEVGSHSLNLLPAFLSPLPVEIVRADLEPAYAGDVGPYVTIRPDEPLPFTNGAFDVTVAMEVLEHIPPGARRLAMSEWSRVASKGIIFTCPNGDSVRDVEARADADFQARNGRVHPWLEEHERYGRPTADEVEAFCQTLGLSHHRFNNSPMAEWLPLLLVTEQVFEHGDQELLARFNEVLNHRPFQAFLQEPGYRSIYAAFKSKEIDQEFQQLTQGSGSVVEPSTVDPVRLLSRRLSQFLIEQRRREVDAAQLVAVKAENQQWKQRLEMTEALLAWECWKNESLRTWQGRWHTLWQQVFGQSTNPLPATELVGLQSFGPNHWLVNGTQPAFEWSCQYQKGWHRLVLEGDVERGQEAWLTLDYGNGLSDVHRINLGAWRAGWDRLAVNAYFDHAVVRMRLTPCYWSRRVVIDRFSIKPIWAGRVALQGVIQSGIELLRSPANWWRKVKHTPSWLRLGMRLTTKPRRRSRHDQQIKRYWQQQQRQWIQQRQVLVKQHQSRENKVAVFFRLDEQDAARGLKETVDSLVRQDPCNWELWCAGSEQRQNCSEVKAVLSQLGERLHWMKAGPERGLAGLINECAQTSQADWLLPLYPGDQVMPELCLQILEAGRCHPEAALLYADESFRSGDHRELELMIKPRLTSEIIVDDPMILGSALAMHGPTLLRLGGLNPCYTGALALEYVNRLMKAQLSLVQIKSVLLHRFSQPRPSGAVQKVLERIREDYDLAEYSISFVKFSDQVAAWNRMTLKEADLVEEVTHAK